MLGKKVVISSKADKRWSKSMLLNFIQLALPIYRQQVSTEDITVVAGKFSLMFILSSGAHHVSYSMAKLPSFLAWLFSQISENPYWHYWSVISYSKRFYRMNYPSSVYFLLSFPNIYSFFFNILAAKAGDLFVESRSWEQENMRWWEDMHYSNKQINRNNRRYGIKKPWW